MLKKFLYALLVIVGVVSLSLSIDYVSAKRYLPNQFSKFTAASAQIIKENNENISVELKSLKDIYPNISIESNFFIEPPIEESIFLLEQRAWYNPINPFGFFRGVFKSRDIVNIESGVSISEKVNNQINIQSSDVVNEFDYYNEEFSEQDYRTSICFSKDIIDQYVEQGLVFSVVAYSEETGQSTYSIYVDDQIEENQQLCYWFDTTLLESIGSYDFYIRLFNKNEQIDVFIPVNY